MTTDNFESFRNKNIYKSADTFLENFAEDTLQAIKFKKKQRQRQLIKLAYSSIAASLLLGLIMIFSTDYENNVVAKEATIEELLIMMSDAELLDQLASADIQLIDEELDD